MKMNKFLVRGFLLVGVVALGIFAGDAMVHAQFGNTDGGAEGMQIKGLAGGENNAGTFSLLTMVKGFINWVLGLLSLVALCMALYGGFSMVTAAGDDTKYKNGFKILKQAAIGLIVVGLSWIIVSSIFWLIGSAGGASQGTAIPNK